MDAEFPPSFSHSLFCLSIILSPHPLPHNPLFPPSLSCLSIPPSQFSLSFPLLSLFSSSLFATTLLLPPLLTFSQPLILPLTTAILLPVTSISPTLPFSNSLPPYFPLHPPISSSSTSLLPHLSFKSNYLVYFEKKHKKIVCYFFLSKFHFVYKEKWCYLLRLR